MLKSHSLGKSWKPVYEGEDDAGAGEGAAGAGEGAAGAGEGAAGAGEGAAGAGEGKLFKQEDVDKIVQKRVAKMKVELENYQKQLNSSKITSAEKDALQQKLEQVSNTLKTEKELADEQKRKLKKQHQEEVSKLSSEKDAWEKRYKQERIEADLIAAATQHKAFSPKQIVRILKDDAVIVEELDGEGKPTGKLTTQVTFRDVKDDAPVVLELSTTEAVKRMKEKIEEFGNLFQSDNAPGLGLLSIQGKGGDPASPPVGDQAAYEAWRKKHTLDKIK